MGIVIQDTFTDTDGVLLQNHAPDIGGRWARVTGGPPNIQISGNKAVGLASNSGPYVHILALPGPEYNIVASVEVLIDTSGAGFVFYARMPLGGNEFGGFNNWYSFEYSPGGGGTLRIRKSVLGVITELTSFVEAWGVSTKIVTFELRNDRKRVLLDGIEKLVTTDNELKDIGRVGITLGDNSKLDNFRVISAGELAIAVSTPLEVIRTPGRIITA